MSMLLTKYVAILSWLNYLISLSIIIQNGQTPLHLAAANNHTSVVEKLVNFKAPVNSVEEVNIYNVNY